MTLGATDQKAFDCAANQTWQTVWNVAGYTGAVVAASSAPLAAGDAISEKTGLRTATIAGGVSGIALYVGNIVKNNGTQNNCYAVPTPPTPHTPPRPPEG